MGNASCIAQQLRRDSKKIAAEKSLVIIFPVEAVGECRLE
jgi:hypothetical protein